MTCSPILQSRQPSHLNSNYFNNAITSWLEPVRPCWDVFTNGAGSSGRPATSSGSSESPAERVVQVRPIIWCRLWNIKLPATFRFLPDETNTASGQWWFLRCYFFQWRQRYRAIRRCERILRPPWTVRSWPRYRLLVLTHVFDTKESVEPHCCNGGTTLVALTSRA